MSAIALTFLIIFTSCFSNVLLAQSDSLFTLSPAQREGYIQKANALRAAEDYAGTIKMLDTILMANPLDAPMLLYKGDVLLQNKKFKEAATTIKKILPLNYKNTAAKINLSYALFMHHRPQNALQYAKEAWTQEPENNNAIVNYFNAMLWNVKTKEAKTFLQAQFDSLKPDQQLVLLARLNMTRGDFNKGFVFYDSLVNTSNSKYYVQENAEVLLGKGEIKKSYASMQANWKLFSVNDSLAYMEKYNAATVHRAGTELVYFKDIAKNIRQEASLFWQEGGTNRIKFGARMGTSKFSVDGEQVSNLTYGQVSSRQRWNSNWSGESEVTIQNIRADSNLTFQAIIGRQAIKYQPHDRRMLTLYYNAEVLNYTSTLLSSNIRAHNIGAITHLLITARTGIYSQGSYAFIGDGNRRTQWFGSIYQLLRTDPTIKVGWNNSYLHFSDNTITNYFSPNRYLSTEIFAELQYKKPEWKNFFFNTQGAIGKQQIEKNDWENAYRYEGELGFNRKHADYSIKYRTSNVAFNTGTGYQFDWFTFQFVYKWN